VWECTEEWDSMWLEWAAVEFAQLNVDDVESGTELVEFDLEQARWEEVSGLHVINRVTSCFFVKRLPKCCPIH
jgi:hypothetical protein